MRRRIAVITDVHANLPALDAALAAIRADGPDAVYHTGDAIGIGPFPAEVLDRLLHEPGLRPVMGNHDGWFAFGLPDPRPPWMSEGELAHQRWTHAQLDPALGPVVAAWPWVIEEEVGGMPVAFLHYALDGTGRGFVDPIPASDAAALDRPLRRNAPGWSSTATCTTRPRSRRRSSGTPATSTRARSVAHPSHWPATLCWTSTRRGPVGSRSGPCRTTRPRSSLPFESARSRSGRSSRRRSSA